MSINERLKGLVDQMPEADGRGMLTENIDKEKIERAIAAIHAGGVEFVGGLIDMLAEPGSETDVKPRYALHALANHVLVVKDEAARKQLCETLAAALDEPAAAKLFAAALEDSDREIRVAAAAGLGRLGDPSAAEAILKVADRAQGWERTQVTKHCVVLAERTAAAGNPQAARRIYDHLLQSRTDAAESHVREAARRGLAALDRSGRS
ncbi:MAG: hypothetical protein DCC68_01430 [Planctomycetota bacterium]|nr:MAG: hypothetical protein DCC68_01430 [Planctomycetota bacterium]